MLFMAKWKIAVTTGSILWQSVLNRIFHFPLKSEKKKGISKQSLVLRNAQATPTFNPLPFFIILVPICHIQAQFTSYEYMKSHHVFMTVSITGDTRTHNKNLASF